MNTSRSSLKLASILASGILSVIAAAAAVAATPASDVPSLTVRFADLDLGTSAGTAALYRRLEYAARIVCNVYEDRTIERQFPWRRCVSDALNRAVAQVGNANLSAYHLAHGAHGVHVAAASKLASAAPARP